MNNLNFDYTIIKKKINNYLFGLILCLILTIIPFFIVIKSFFSHENSIIIVVICSILQVLIHLKYFLHVQWLKVNYWSIMFLFFTIVVVLIIITGSVWIMYNLKHHILHHLYV